MAEGDAVVPPRGRGSRLKWGQGSLTAHPHPEYLEGFMDGESPSIVSGPQINK